MADDQPCSCTGECLHLTLRINDPCELQATGDDGLCDVCRDRLGKLEGANASTV